MHTNKLQDFKTIFVINIVQFLASTLSIVGMLLNINYDLEERAGFEIYLLFVAMLLITVDYLTDNHNNTTFSIWELLFGFTFGLFGKDQLSIEINIAFLIVTTCYTFLSCFHYYNKFYYVITFSTSITLAHIPPNINMIIYKSSLVVLMRSCVVAWIVYFIYLEFLLRPEESRKRLHQLYTLSAQLVCKAMTRISQVIKRR